MSRTLLLRDARQVLTLRGFPGLRRGVALGNLSIIENGSVLIRDGVIDCLGTTRRMENLKQVRGVRQVSVDGAVIMPAFVDPDLQVEPSARPRHALDVRAETMRLLRSCLEYGTLHANISVGSSPANRAADLTLLRQFAKMRDCPIGWGRSWLLSRELDSETDALVKRLQASRTLQSIQLPSHSFRLDYQVRVQNSRSPIPISNQPFASSCEKPRFVRCPSNLNLEESELLLSMRLPLVFGPLLAPAQSSYEAMQRLLAADAAIALSSGYHSECSPVFNMQMTIALAVLNLHLTPEQAITAATYNSACALNMQDQLGSLEAGKRASLLVLSVPDYREISRRWGVNNVGMVLRDGNIVLDRMGWSRAA